MHALVDLIADLAEENWALNSIDGQGFAAALLRELPGLALLSAEQLRDGGEIGYRRLQRRREALGAVLIELELLGEQVTPTVVRREWKRFARSAVAAGWRERGGPGRDANELDARLFHLHLHNRWQVLGERQLRTLLSELRAVEARSAGAAPTPLTVDRSCGVASPDGAAGHSGEVGPPPPPGGGFRFFLATPAAGTSSLDLAAVASAKKRGCREQ